MDLLEPHKNNVIEKIEIIMQKIYLLKRNFQKTVKHINIRHILAIPFLIKPSPKLTNSSFPHTEIGLISTVSTENATPANINAFMTILTPSTIDI